MQKCFKDGVSLVWFLFLEEKFLDIMNLMSIELIRAHYRSIETVNRELQNPK